MIKSGGNPIDFISRPIAGVLAVITITIWLLPVFAWLKRRRIRLAKVEA
jgi:TctA family transporter